MRIAANVRVCGAAFRFLTNASNLQSSDDSFARVPQNNRAVTHTHCCGPLTVKSCGLSKSWQSVHEGLKSKIVRTSSLVDSVQSRQFLQRLTMAYNAYVYDGLGFRSASLSHDTKRYLKKLNYKFTLNPAIDYAFCWVLWGFRTL